MNFMRQYLALLLNLWFTEYMLDLKANLPGKGILALVGAGEYLPEMEVVDTYLLHLLTEPVRVVCLPTAAGSEGQKRVQYWMDKGVEYFQRIGVKQVQALPLTHRNDAFHAPFVEQLQRANFVYLSGGKPAYLYQTLVNTPAWDAIQGVMQKGGVVAGCSAGAMIFGERVLASPAGTGTFQGFGFVQNACIIPHYDEIPRLMLESAAALLHRWLFVGIEGFTALIFTPQGRCVRGKGKVELRFAGERLPRFERDGFW